MARLRRHGGIKANRSGVGKLSIRSGV
jgi:hypothetical protein